MILHTNVPTRAQLEWLLAAREPSSVSPTFRRTSRARSASPRSETGHPAAGSRARKPEDSHASVHTTDRPGAAASTQRDRHALILAAAEPIVSIYRFATAGIGRHRRRRTRRNLRPRRHRARRHRRGRPWPHRRRPDRGRARTRKAAVDAARLATLGRFVMSFASRGMPSQQTLRANRWWSPC
jgi:hypothetical protein